MNPVLAAWLVEAGIITVRDLTGPARRLPLPSEFLGAFVVFGGLSVIAESPSARTPANFVAWGLVLATLYVAYAPPSEGGLGIDLLKPVGDFLGGKTTGTNAAAAQQLANYKGPAPTVGSGANDTGNILSKGTAPTPGLSAQRRKEF